MEIAIAVNKIKKDQMLFDIKNQTINHNIIVYSNFESYLNRNYGFSILNMYDLWNSSADYHISTCLNTTKNLLLSPRIEKIFFYVWNLEWFKFIYNYDDIKNIYLNNRVNLIARSDDHAKAIKTAWNIDPKISYNFDITNIIEA